MHPKHRTDQDGLIDELVRLDWLSVMYHIRQHVQRLLATLSCCLVETCREECVKDPDTIEAILAEVCLRYFDILSTDSSYLNGALRRLWLQVECLDQVLIILGN